MIRNLPRGPEMAECVHKIHKVLIRIPSRNFLRKYYRTFCGGATSFATLEISLAFFPLIKLSWSHSVRNATKIMNLPIGHNSLLLKTMYKNVLSYFQGLEWKFGFPHRFSLTV